MTSRERAALADLLPRLEHMLAGPKQLYTISRLEVRAVALAARSKLGVAEVTQDEIGVKA